MNKTYKVIISELSDGSVEVDQVAKASNKHTKLSSVGRSDWRPMDKRKFTRKFLNSVEHFQTK
jgi:hypothetical protein